MGRKEYLIDTNVAIEYIGEVLSESSLKKLDTIIDRKFSISVINKIELLGFADITENEELKFQELIDAADIINLGEDIIHRTIKVRRQFKIKLPDAIIAATALVNNLALITRNTKDFDKIEGLDIINPLDL